MLELLFIEENTWNTWCSVSGRMMNKSRAHGLGLKSRPVRMTLLWVFVTEPEEEEQVNEDSWKEPQSHRPSPLRVTPATPISAGATAQLRTHSAEGSCRALMTTF